MVISGKSRADTVPILSNAVVVKGEWQAPPRSAALVIGRMREACCFGYRLLSDRQPSKLWVENRSSGPPAVWLHQDDTNTAIIFVDVGERAWSQLAYQFGHELGHVISNSWESNAKPYAPCQWVEETIVESLSLYGLGILAADWERRPPFPNDGGYGKHIKDYRDDIIAQYSRLASEQGLNNTDYWFSKHRQSLEEFVGLSQFAKAAVSAVLPAISENRALLEDVGALNRWPERAALPLNDYIKRWRLSCKELKSPGRLPDLIDKKFLSMS